MKIQPFMNALANAAPNATIRLLHAQDWHSITFAGQKLTIELVVASATISMEIERTLPEYAFAVADTLVADIAVIETQSVGDGTRMRIEALLLDV